MKEIEVNQEVKCFICEKGTRLHQYELFHGVLVICFDRKYFSVQAGAFRTKEEAERYAVTILAFLKEGGVYIINNKPLFKVRIGYFRNRDDAHNTVIYIKPLIELFNRKMINR